MARARSTRRWRSRLRSKCLHPRWVRKEIAADASHELETDWAGALGLLVCGLLTATVVALTATTRIWEIGALGAVVGLTVVLSIMSEGARSTWLFFDRTSWIVRHPVRAAGLNGMIAHARMIISTAYAVGVFTSIVSGVAIAVYAPEMLQPASKFIAVVLKPMIYAALFAEFWIRPFKRKLQRMLASQAEQRSV